MKDQNTKGKIAPIKEHVVHIKDYVVAMPKKRKITIGVIAGGIILFAIILTLFLNFNQSGYCVLYKNIDSSEASQVYQTLKELGAEPQMNAAGEVMVPKQEYDVWLLQLAEKGFPQTALPYDIFSSHTGMTTTEAERQQWLVYQLQDRLQATLKRMSGVNNAVVTITMPESTDYVWEQATKKQPATASVLLTLKPGVTLTAGQVTAMKNLVASAVPKMEVADVTAVDAQTLLELQGEGETNGISTTQNLEFEQIVQKQIEDNIVRVLTPRYGKDGVVAVAKATINYDKMITEKMELQEKPKDENGKGGGGFTTHTEGEYTLNGKETVGGIVGEENNTDIPSYSYSKPDEKDTTHYTWNTDIDYSYIKTQIEKGNAILERATVSVMVKDENLSQERQTELINLVSKSADIDKKQIFVSSFKPEVADDSKGEAQSDWGFLEMIPLWAYFAAGGVVLLVVFLIIMITAMKRKAKRKKELAALQQEEDEKRRAQEEILAYKRQLSEAKSGPQPKEAAIMDEVRNFAKDNPEITASLLRSWLKEGE